MREHPWHLPSSTTKHTIWFRNLADFHELTLAWLKELQIERAPHLLPRTHAVIPTQDLWMLDSLVETKMDTFLDDTTPSDMLGRLEHTVWTVQGWTLLSLMERAGPAESQSLLNVLESTAWKLGRKVGQRRWEGLADSGKQDLRSLVLALADSPFFGGTRSWDGILVRRATASEMLIELHRCPHHASQPEVLACADPLCQLHTHWIRGFIYSLNSEVRIEIQKQEPRCVQRWILMTG